MDDQAEKAQRFMALHRQTHPFVLANAWDTGSAKLLASLGFSALGGTSSGYAATVGRRDYGVSRDEAVAHAEALVAATPSSEELLDERRAHELLRRVLDALPVDLRIVFVLYELEELTTGEIASMIGVPLGTAASRLRRAREAFLNIARRMQAASKGRGTP